MELVRELPEGHLFVRATTDAAIVVGERTLTRSFLLTPEAVVESWTTRGASGLDADAVAKIIALEPEVVLLGTGPAQDFPPREALIPMLRRQIGVEVMDNAAAARTFNLLASEYRRVVAAFILPA